MRFYLCNIFFYNFIFYNMMTSLQSKKSQNVLQDFQDLAHSIFSGLSSSLTAFCHTCLYITYCLHCIIRIYSLQRQYEVGTLSYLVQLEIDSTVDCKCPSVVNSPRFLSAAINWSIHCNLQNKTLYDVQFSVLESERARIGLLLNYRCGTLVLAFLDVNILNLILASISLKNCLPTYTSIKRES